MCHLFSRRRQSQNRRVQNASFIEKWRNQDRDTLANQNSSDTNMQSRTSTNHPWQFRLMHKPVVLSTNGNRYLFYVTFLAATLWISLRRTRKGYPHTPFRFLYGFTRFGKMTPEDFQKTEFRHKLSPLYMVRVTLSCTQSMYFVWADVIEITTLTAFHIVRVLWPKIIRIILQANNLA